MLSRVVIFFCFAVCLSAEWLWIRTVDGTHVEGQADISAVTLMHAGKPTKIRMADVLSVHSGAPASEYESRRIAEGIAAIQGKERKARDLAVEELTEIGVPVVTPLLKSFKDTDQHEPRPLYRLFERIMPSNADGFDRSPGIVRLNNGTSLRGDVSPGTIVLRKADGAKADIPWASVRALAVRRKVVRRSTPVHSLRHSTQIEYLDTGIVLSRVSKLDITAQGFARLSWDQDGWACDPDGLKKPGSPAYKSHLFAGQPFGALVGRVGANSEAPFFIGKRSAKADLAPGRLALAINDNPHWQNNVGSYSVIIHASDAYDLGEPQ